MSASTMTDPAAAGLLALEMVLGPDGRTRVASAAQRFPQRVTAPMYLDEHAPHAAYLCVQNPTGGVFPGDRLHTRALVHPGAHLQLTGQSATQVYAADDTTPGGTEPSVSHDIELTVHGGSVLEHPQRTTIPHRGSRYRQSTRIELHGDAVYLGWEVVAAGRIGHGERFEYEYYLAGTTVEHNSVVRAREVTRLCPRRQHPSTGGILGRHTYLASFLALCPERPVGQLVRLLRSALDDHPEVLGAASPLPDTLGVSVRLLADRAPAVRAALGGLWSTARAEVLGLRAPSGRLW